MKVLIEVSNKNNLYLDRIDGIILPLENFSVESICFSCAKPLFVSRILKQDI